MGDRGLAPVVDLSQARQRRRGAQLLRAAGRRTNPGLRPMRVVMGVDYEKLAGLDRSELAAIDKGTRQPPLVVRKIRRIGNVAPNPKAPWSRQARRIAWKIERRETAGEKVAWAGSKAARCDIAPVIPLSHRGSAARHRVPLVSAPAGSDLLDGAA